MLTEIGETLAAIREEAAESRAKYGPYRSVAEAYGVLSEEMYELLVAMHANDDKQARAEALQIAAVAYRFARDGWFRGEESP